MEAPEYLDLDEIDFSDDSAYCVTSLKNIPELSRRGEGEAEERPAHQQQAAINWNRGVSSHSGSGVGGGAKPSGLAEVHSKFRPVKRVSPLKHQPDTSDHDPDGKGQGAGPGAGESEKDDKPAAASDAPGGKAKCPGVGAGLSQPLFGELEHYDLDMDEILDVPYIKSSQQNAATLPRLLQHDKRNMAAGGGTLDRSRGATNAKNTSGVHGEPLSLNHNNNTQPQYCVLSPVKWSDLRKSQSDLDRLHRSPGGGAFPSELLPPGLLSSASLSSFTDADKLLSARVFPDPPRSCVDPPGGAAGLPFSPVGRPDALKLRGGGGGGGGGGGARGFEAVMSEVDEEAKKNQNIINIIRDGQISLLPHLAADNLECIRDDGGNNLLHISASRGHADVLQHLTSLMGEDGLTERNQQLLTPAGLGVKNGHLECVRWMVSETEAIAELSCTREHPSLIHYAARHGQEKVLLWLLQFMQEQAISLDEVDQNGNTAVHVAAQYGHLTCIQTLVEYGSNVTVSNQQGERPSQCAERQGHTTCARYLVVVETCMSLASQVVKLTKQLNEQAAERVTLQKQLQRLMEPNKTEETPSGSPSSHPPSLEAWPEMLLTAEGTPGDAQWLVRQGGAGPDSVLRQLLGKDVSEARGPLGGGVSREGRGRRAGLAEQRELKLARLKQIMQRSLSESDSDVYPQEDGRSAGAPPTAPRPDRPTHLPLAEESASNHLELMMSTQLPATSDRKLAFSLSGSKSVDSIGFNATPTSCDADSAHEGQKAATSPKSALKSPSSRRKTSQNLKLRVTFDEQVHQSATQGAEPSRAPPPKDRTQGGASESKRPFGAFRSIMETLSGNNNHNNNNAGGGATTTSTNQNSPGRKSDSKGSPGGGAKGKSRSSNV